ncbi:cytochrome c [Mucilaginibacter oryzae]|uniref:Cytochrome c n=1 Tax=Mucilaginibacter oryzae TaxID=468058 RepID=A0A316HB55_9SPHI|nr:c-type cytochrome [Mucilaginibacter oryzae]PWK77210.1 cytochrome c [Mucilaginibacter oryzae]
MKKIYYLMLPLALVAACKGNSSDENKGGSDSAKAVNVTAKARNSDADTNVMKIGTEPTGGEAGSAMGQKLMASSDCNTCHHTDSKLIGPAFQDVASRYPASKANISMLAKKVITGGSGHWGNIAMTPHPYNWTGPTSS